MSSGPDTHLEPPGSGATEASTEAASGGAEVGTAGHEAGLWKDAWSQPRRPR